MTQLKLQNCCYSNDPFTTQASFFALLYTLDRNVNCMKMGSTHSRTKYEVSKKLDGKNHYTTKLFNSTSF